MELATIYIISYERKPICFGINEKNSIKIIYGKNCFNRGIKEIMKNPNDKYEYYIKSNKEIIDSMEFKIEKFKNFLTMKKNNKTIKINFINSIFPLNKEDISFLVGKKRILLNKEITEKNYLEEKWYIINHCKRDLEIMLKLMYLLKDKNTLSNKKWIDWTL